MIPIEELLPQAAPMVLLSGYSDSTDEMSVESFVDVTESSPFYDVDAGGVPSCVALEYMAQTMALCVGLMRRKKNLDPQVGFVLGSRRLEFRTDSFKKGARYRVHVTCTFQDEEFGSFDCVILNEANEELAAGTLTAFQPGGDLSAESLAAYG